MPDCAPARGEVVEVDARAVGGIEERPQARGAERASQAEIGERLQEVGKALVAALAGRDGDPQDGARAAAEAGDQRGAGPAFAGEDLGLPGISKTGSSRVFSQTMGSLGRWTSSRLMTGTLSLPGRKPNESASGGFAFEDEECALFDALHEMRGSGSAGANDEDAGGGIGLRLEADRGQDLRPGTGIGGEDGEGGGERRRAGGVYGCGGEQRGNK